MSKRRRKSKAKAAPAAFKTSNVFLAAFKADYRRACNLAVQGIHREARRIYERLAQTSSDQRQKALLVNDQATLDWIEGKPDEAIRGWQRALALDAHCEPARKNLSSLNGEVAKSSQPTTSTTDSGEKLAQAEPTRVKVGVVSFLFNWPSMGGGIVHTVELCQFLARAGYEVRHFYVRYTQWRIGEVQGTPLESVGLDFSDAEWNVPTIQAKLRRAVDGFGPDHIIIMDAWNMKPHLAVALRGYVTWIRLQALELLCPLDNIRLLMDGPDTFRQCPKHQLATPTACGNCLQERGHHSGQLHQLERQLAGVGTPGYHETLLQALREVEGVLVLNPFTEMMVSPYAQRVIVAPWGMDPARFPWPEPDRPAEQSRPLTIFQAGVVDEPMKGFRILHEACSRLWHTRQDFRLVTTGSPAGQIDPFTHFTGWKSQSELPELYREADIVVVPTIAQEGLSRTSVEAMAAGRPVVASRIGGLPFTVADGATGLLCEPGNFDDLAAKLGTLLDDGHLRRQMGLAGRKRFEAEFAWPVVIERHYRPLLSRVQIACSRR